MCGIWNLTKINSQKVVWVIKVMEVFKGKVSELQYVKNKVIYFKCVFKAVLK